MSETASSISEDSSSGPKRQKSKKRCIILLSDSNPPEAAQIWGQSDPNSNASKSGRQSKIILVSNHKVSGTFWDYIGISVKSEWHFVSSASAVFEDHDNYVMTEVSNHSQSEWHFFRLQRDFGQKRVALCRDWNGFSGCVPMVPETLPNPKVSRMHGKNQIWEESAKI